MKFIVIALGLIISPLHAGSNGMLVLDQDMDVKTPRQFRTSLMSYKNTSHTEPSRQGLEKLNISGSAQFSEFTLQEILKQIPISKVWIVDLRRESHGFIDGLPVSWYAKHNASNLGLDTSEILKKEKAQLDLLSKKPMVQVNTILKKEEGVIKAFSKVDIPAKNIQTESALAHELHTAYLRIPVSDHHKPENAQIDAFITFVQTLPPDAWLHFHCRGGKGRTTTFMILYDILRNGKQVALEEIVQRQALLGGSTLFKISDNTEDNWKREPAVQRKDFISAFYQYATAADGYPKNTWTTWLGKKT